MTTRDTDRGFRRILGALRKGAASMVSVGWFPDAEHESIPTAGIAVAHELGVPESNLPARPMIGAVVDQNQTAYREKLRELWGQVVIGKMTVESALTIFGARVEADLKRWITTGPHVPLSPKTIQRKGSSRPLIDTGVMRDQVMNRVVIGKFR